MHDFKPYRKKTANVGDLVAISYELDGRIIVKDALTGHMLGTCRGVTLEYVSFHNAYDVKAIGRIVPPIEQVYCRRETEFLKNMAKPYVFKHTLKHVTDSIAMYFEEYGRIKVK